MTRSGNANPSGNANLAPNHSSIQPPDDIPQSSFPSARRRRTTIMIPARGPQTGVGLPNGLRRREFRSSKMPVVRQHRRKNTFLRGFLKNPSVESVAGEHTQLSPKDFPLSFTRVPFFLESPILLLILCADFELGAGCLPLGGLRWLALACEWLSFDCVIS